jgi:hypothetical protein
MDDVVSALIVANIGAEHTRLVLGQHVVLPTAGVAPISRDAQVLFVVTRPVRVYLLVARHGEI